MSGPKKRSKPSPEFKLKKAQQYLKSTKYDQNLQKQIIDSGNVLRMFTYPVEKYMRQSLATMSNQYKYFKEKNKNK